MVKLMKLPPNIPFQPDLIEFANWIKMNDEISSLIIVPIIITVLESQNSVCSGSNFHTIKQ